MHILPQSFYNRPTLKVAQDLLGCFLVILPSGKSRTTNAAHANSTVRYKIVEVEAYDGLNDLASHASRGRTERNKIMFGPAGMIYVYFTYGMYYMLNIVTGVKDYPAAVLIRAVEPPPPLVTSPRLRSGQTRERGAIITNGPGKLTKVLGIDKRFHGLPIYVKRHGLWIESGERIKPSQIKKTTRIGVDYAGKYRDKNWRFYIRGNQFISRK